MSIFLSAIYAFLSVTYGGHRSVHIVRLNIERMALVVIPKYISVSLYPNEIKSLDAGVYIRPLTVRQRAKLSVIKRNNLAGANSLRMITVQIASIKRWWKITPASYGKPPFAAIIDSRRLSTVDDRHTKSNAINAIKPVIADHFRSNIGAQLPFCGVSCNTIRLDRQSQSDDDTNRAHSANDKSVIPPICRVSSGSCGIPLGAKIGLVVIFAIGAWGLIFASIARFGNLVLSCRNRIEGMLYALSGIGLFGVIGIIWGWTGS